MVRELCRFVILGHSERRTLFGETDETVNRRVLAAQKFDLTPIFCVGETLGEYESGQTSEIVHRQVTRGLSGLQADFAQRLVMAYEPVWAIGTGKASTAESAGRVVAEVIRPALGELFANAEIDGALVGGASLKAEDFVAITRAAAPGL
jgi:triosephosphate isomerase